MKWWQVRFTIPFEASDAAAAVLQEWPEVQGVSLEGGAALSAPHPEFGEWLDEMLEVGSNDVIVTVYVPDYVAETEIRQRLEESLTRVWASGFRLPADKPVAELLLMDESEWENAWKEDFQPIPIGERLLVVPKWWEDKVDAKGRISVVLEPGMAFGTGTHATTQLCLEALEGLPLSASRVLDIGCGTAVLAIAAAKLGASSVKAIDIDPVAVRAAAENIVDNGLGGVVQAEQGDLLTAVDGERYDVAIANILRDIVIAVTPQAVDHLVPGGYLLTSGFVTSQEAPVRAALEAHGFEVVRRLQKEDWVALVARLRT